MPEVRETQSVGELFSDISEQIKTLFRDELEMLRLEMSIKASKAGKHIGLIAAGGAILFTGALAIVWAVAWLLALAFQVWFAFLLVGVAASASGFLLIRKNMAALKRGDFRPNRTITSLRQIREAGTWLKKQT